MSSLMSSGSAAGLPPNHAAHPPTSAPVLEFVCLFTHDLKRKQKRWQDGRIKYHTFNKRVMVYDDRGNFVGDMHWRRDWDFDDGEEVELERGGVIVQVNECVGRQNQDLTELVDKRVKEREERQAKIAARPSILRGLAVRTPMPKPRRPPPPQDNCQTRHRPLHQVIGTPSGHYGRAVVPTESPFEQRQKATESPAGEINPRPSKRQKRDTTPPSKRGYAQSLFGATLNLSAVPLSSAPVRRPAPQQSRAWADTPPPSKHQHDNSPPASSPELPSGSVLHKVPSRSNGIPSPGRAPQHRETSPPARDLAQRNETGKPGLVGHNDRASRDPTRNTASTYFGDANSSATKAQPNIGSRDSSTRNLLEPARRPAKRRENAANHPPTLEPADKPRMREAAQVIILDGGLEDESQGQMAPPVQRLETPALGRESAVSEIRTKRRPPNKKRETLPSSRIPPEPKFDTTSTLLLVTPPPTEERTELRLGPRQKRGLLMVAEPKLPKAKKAKKSKSASNQPATERSTAHRTITNADDGPSRDMGRRTSHTPVDEDVFSLSPPKSKTPPTPQSLGRPPAPSLGSGVGAETAFEELEPLISVVQPFAKAPIPTVEKPFAHQTGVETSGPSLRHCGVATENSSPAAENHDDANDAHLNRANHEGRTQPTPLSDNTGCHCPDDDSSLATASRHKPKPNEPEKQAPRASEQAFEVESSDDELPRVPIGPRLARLPRKSIKSREVIGYIPSSSPVPGLQSRRPPSLPAAQHIGKSSSGIDATTPLELDEVQRVDDGLHEPKEIEALGQTVEGLAASSPPVQEQLPPLIQTSELPDGGPSLEIVNHSALPCESTGQHVSESGEQEPSLPWSEQRQRASESTNDAEILGDITSARPTDPPHSMTSVTEHTAIPEATKSLAPAAVSPNADTGAEREGSAQPGPTGQTKDGVPASNAASLPCGLGSTSSVGGCPPEKKNVDASSSCGPNNAPRRIANPATRGRKAALKSHAAGQVPQSVLPPPDPVMPRPNVRLPCKTRLDSAGNERPKRKMQFPGFISAKEGGPWSKEADDLLGIGRPTP